MDEREHSDSAEPIYEGSRVQASKIAGIVPPGDRILNGMIAGVAFSLLIDLLGVPQIFGVGFDATMIPFALLAGLLALSRFRRVIPIAAALLFVLTLIVAYTGAADALALRFVRTDPLPKSADAVVALSAGVTADGYMTQQATDRTLKAVELVKNGMAPVLVITREERRGRGFLLSPESDQRRIASLSGVNQVLTTKRVKSTHDEAVAVATVARARGWRRIVLVTSPFHSRRACATFEKTGLAVTCIPSDSRDIAVKRLRYPHDRLGAFGMLLYETVGTLRYRQLGWI
jgi:uncharacterized SAM-binding protein YcdF (DUF218 family)